MSAVPTPKDPNPALTSHFITHLPRNQSQDITITPVVQKKAADTPESSQHKPDDVGSKGHYEPIRDDPGRLPCVYPKNPIPFENRVAVDYEPQGYMHIGPRHNEESETAYMSTLNKPQAEDEGEKILLAEERPVPTGTSADYVTPDAFQEIAKGFQGEDGRFLAMTAYGAVPLPEEMLKKIPEKFHSQPLLQEREVFVLRRENHVCRTEQEFTEFHHTFKQVPQSIEVNRLETISNARVVDVPHFKYIPVVEERNVAIPAGIKYVEVPIEVVCRAPPKIVPVPKPHIIERVIETTKPVVQEKIIEVPEIVKKKVPRVVTKEIPYVVAKYVEKIIEVPYKSSQQMPPPQGRPMNIVPKPPRHPSQLRDHSEKMAAKMSARVENDELIVDADAGVNQPQTFFVAGDIQHIELPFEAAINVSIVEADDVPPGAAIAQRGVRYIPLCSKETAYGQQEDLEEINPDEPVYAGPMNPIIEHTTPGMRAVDFKTRSEEPDILTQQGVIKYSKFKCCLKNDVTKLLPALPEHELVPSDPKGAPCLKALAFAHSQRAQRLNEVMHEKCVS